MSFDGDIDVLRVSAEVEPTPAFVPEPKEVDTEEVDALEEEVTEEKV